VWEDGLAAFARALAEACVECDVKHIQAMAVQQDFLAQTRASSSWSKQLHHLSQMSEERQILLCLQEMNLEVQEVILAEEQVCGLHPFDGRDLSAELEEIRPEVALMSYPSLSHLCCSSFIMCIPFLSRFWL
jgi:hypothetical protein